MDDYYFKRSGQIPAFGDWENANQLPITQYFESARQAGLLRYSSSSGDSHPYTVREDFYAVDTKKYSRNLAADPPRKASRARNRRGPQIKEQKRQGKVCDCDVTAPPRKQAHAKRNTQQIQNDVDAPRRLGPRPPKAVDEDLYKIPPELLNSSKRKKMPGFFACLVPACAS
ncbi:hypothetical protein SLEP1_g24572 [Rubroshorea leprosula]|uniref:Uncharacterized protein n=1 Tax=Rubroshorea leprosula TaxID=152421 RepID=A0AAV5JPV5_9ROSI|nr:hypothetical protein SLEP1_g24572 [Rubroshorea leprosula]